MSLIYLPIVHSKADEARDYNDPNCSAFDALDAGYDPSTDPHHNPQWDARFDAYDASGFPIHPRPNAVSYDRRASDDERQPSSSSSDSESSVHGWGETSTSAEGPRRRRRKHKTCTLRPAQWEPRPSEVSRETMAELFAPKVEPEIVLPPSPPPNSIPPLFHKFRFKTAPGKREKTPKPPRPSRAAYPGTHGLTKAKRTAAPKNAAKVKPSLHETFVHVYNPCEPLRNPPVPQPLPPVPPPSASLPQDPDPAPDTPISLVLPPNLNVPVVELPVDIDAIARMYRLTVEQCTVVRLQVTVTCMCSSLEPSHAQVSDAVRKPGSGEGTAVLIPARAQDESVVASEQGSTGPPRGESADPQPDTGVRSSTEVVTSKESLPTSSTPNGTTNRAPVLNSEGLYSFTTDQMDVDVQPRQQGQDMCADTMPVTYSESAMQKAPMAAGPSSPCTNTSQPPPLAPLSIPQRSNMFAQDQSTSASGSRYMSPLLEPSSPQDAVTTVMPQDIDPSLWMEPPPMSGDGDVDMSPPPSPVIRSGTMSTNPDLYRTSTHQPPYTHDPSPPIPQTYQYPPVPAPQHDPPSVPDHPPLMPHSIFNLPAPDMYPQPTPLIPIQPTPKMNSMMFEFTGITEPRSPPPSPPPPPMNPQSLEFYEHHKIPEPPTLRWRQPRGPPLGQESPPLQSDFAADSSVAPGTFISSPLAQSLSASSGLPVPSAAPVPPAPSAPPRCWRPPIASLSGPIAPEAQTMVTWRLQPSAQVQRKNAASKAKTKNVTGPKPPRKSTKKLCGFRSCASAEPQSARPDPDMDEAAAALFDHVQMHAWASVNMRCPWRACAYRFQGKTNGFSNLRKHLLTHWKTRSGTVCPLCFNPITVNGPLSLARHYASGWCNALQEIAIERRLPVPARALDYSHDEDTIPPVPVPEYGSQQY